MASDTESINKRLDAIVYLLLKAGSPEASISIGEKVKELNEMGLELEVVKKFGEKGRQIRWGHQ
jgi:hypothetical protein